MASVGGIFLTEEEAPVRRGLTSCSGETKKANTTTACFPEETRRCCFPTMPEN
jgi:hypothetical protein